MLLIKSPEHNLTKGFPKFDYEGGHGYTSVKFTLKYDEFIRADAGAMNYMSPFIKTHTSAGGSFTGYFSRVIAGASGFFNIFYNDVRDTTGVISFSSAVPGSIGCFYIPAGKSFLFVSFSYICSTPNLIISAKAKTGNFFLGGNLIYIEVKAPENSAGLVWCASFGEIIEIPIKPGDSMNFDNGVLVGFDPQLKMNTKVSGGFKSFFLGGEAFITNIKNEGTEISKVYLQSRSVITFENYIRVVAGVKQY